MCTLTLYSVVFAVYAGNGLYLYFYSVYLYVFLFIVIQRHIVYSVCSWGVMQGCISCGILVSGIRARGVSSEHMENMEMFSCSPT